MLDMFGSLHEFLDSERAVEFRCSEVVVAAKGCDDANDGATRKTDDDATKARRVLMHDAADGRDDLATI